MSTTAPDVCRPSSPTSRRSPTGRFRPSASATTSASRARWTSSRRSTTPRSRGFEDALAYLDQFELDALPDDAQNLLWLYCALVTVSFPVEVWRQPRVPDSGASTFDEVVAPAI